MMWKEFEDLAGYEVSYDDYANIIEPMYMATKLSKAEFIACIDKKRFALKTKKQIVSEMKKLAARLQETCDHYTDWDALNRMEELRKEYSQRFASGYVWLRTETTMPGYRGCSYPAVLCEESAWNSSYNMETRLVERRY